MTCSTCGRLLFPTRYFVKSFRRDTGWNYGVRAMPPDAWGCTTSDQVAALLDKASSDLYIFSLVPWKEAHFPHE